MTVTVEVESTLNSRPLARMESTHTDAREVASTPMILESVRLYFT